MLYRMTGAGGLGRSRAHAATNELPSATATNPATSARARGDAARAPPAMDVVARVAKPGLASAAANSAAVANRSAGSFSSACSTAASTCGGMVCRWLVSERGCSVTTRATMACAVEPVNGGSPVSIS